MEEKVDIKDYEIFKQDDEIPNHRCFKSNRPIRMVMPEGRLKTNT